MIERIRITRRQLILYKTGMFETLELKQSNHVIYIVSHMNNKLDYLLHFDYDKDTINSEDVYVDVTIT